MKTDMNEMLRRAAGHVPSATTSEPELPADLDERAWEESERPIREAIERAASRAGFVDPADVVATVRYTVPTGADGLPDPQALAAAVQQIARTSPHLVLANSRMNAVIRAAVGPSVDDRLRQPELSPHGSGDGGARRSSPAGVDMNALLRASARVTKERIAEELG